MSTDPWRVTREAKAWDCIGYDGTFRIKGGRACYDAISYNCSRNPSTVLLSRLGNYHGTTSRGIRQYNRRVGLDTMLEFLEPAGP